MGRTAVSQEGLRRYKLGFGAKERTVEYLKYDYHRQAFVDAPPPSLEWSERLFRLLPVSINRIFGQLLYRHWA